MKIYFNFLMSDIALMMVLTRIQFEDGPLSMNLLSINLIIEDFITSKSGH